jgi:drug/metabolite transporter (DMT)-like permease
MSAWGWWQGERLWRRQIAGLLLALAGLIWLLLPGVSAPPLRGALLMMTAGVAWATYSLLGRTVATPIRSTSGNFLRAVPMALLAMALLRSGLHWDGAGALLAVGSGAVASGLGYALWYRLLPHLKAIQAATLQLSVPVLAAVGAVVWLGEPLTLRAGMASAAVLGGIALVVTPSASKASARQLDSG